MNDMRMFADDTKLWCRIRPKNKKLIKSSDEIANVNFLTTTLYTH